MHPIHRSSSGIQNLIQFSSALIQYLTRAISKNPGKNRKNWSKGKKSRSKMIKNPKKFPEILKNWSIGGKRRSEMIKKSQEIPKN